MAMAEIRSLAINHGLSGSEGECDSGSDVEEADLEGILTDELKVKLIELLWESKCNWFEFISRIESDSKENLHKECQRSYQDLPSYDLSNEEVEPTQQSYTAFKCDEEQHSYNQEKIAQMFNGDIVTDSESDDPDLYHKDKGLAIKRKVESLKRSARRRQKELLVENSLNGHTLSRPIVFLKSTLSIEEYVQCGSRYVGRTGMLTFDGNTRVKKKAMYRRIKDYLEDRYGRTFLYGTVVELCVARNKRRKSS